MKFHQFIGIMLPIMVVVFIYGGLEIHGKVKTSIRWHLLIILVMILSVGVGYFFFTIE